MNETQERDTDAPAPKKRWRLVPDDPEVGWTPYAWLIWLTPFVLTVFRSERGLTTQVLGALTLVVFLFLYLRSFWLPPRLVMWCSLAVFALAALWAPFEPLAFTFYIYGAAMVGSWMRAPKAYFVLALMAVWAVAEGWLLGQHAGMWLPPAVLIGLIGGINVHYCEVSRKNARMRLAQAEIEQLAVSAERERIGRDLHDLLGQSLSVISLKSQLARRLLDSEPGRSRAELEEIERTAREALREVRRAVAGYRHVQIATELVKARVALEAAAIELDTRTPPLDLDPETESVLALALREAITNVVRHSGANRCRIRTRSEVGKVWLEIEDDGSSKGGHVQQGSGLLGMRERLEALGGELELLPSRFASSGILLRASLPAQSSREARFVARAGTSP